MADIADDALPNFIAVFSDSVRTEPTPLLWVVTIDKTDAAAADARILSYHLTHDIGQLIRLTQILLDLVDTITGSSRDLIEHPRHCCIGC